ncbi:hypothetical protein ACCO45_013126 [Purpureocillium lilacinum]|uniref:Uncharacterized protein n=1 Tax=Purpureocillium lilacinum TaxID=33203 RepID=A0ACC4DD08_PURLI
MPAPGPPPQQRGRDEGKGSSSHLSQAKWCVFWWAAAVAGGATGGQWRLPALLDFHVGPNKLSLPTNNTKRSAASRIAIRERGTIGGGRCGRSSGSSASHPTAAVSPANERGPVLVSGPAADPVGPRTRRRAPA